MIDYKKMTISQIRKDIINKKISVAELVNQHHKIAQRNELNSFITVIDEKKIKTAIEKAQNNINNGKAKLLEGIPGSLKDLVCTKGIKTTANSQILENFVPDYNATIAQELKDENYILIGKNNLDEFAMGSTTTNGYHGSAFNYIKNNKNNKNDLIPGGSSGGSAVSIQEGSSLFSIGSDTGGSLRQPASLCGIVGTKPSYGLCSRYGCIDYSNSLDQAGVMTNNVEDAALILDIICRYDKKDSTSIPENMRKFKSFSEKINENIKGLKIGVLDSFNDFLTPEIKNNLNSSLKVLNDNGCEIINNLKIENLDLSILIYYILSCTDAFSNLLKFDGIRYGYKHHKMNEDYDNIEDMYSKNRTNIFGKEAVNRMILGEFISTNENYESYYIKAAKIRRQYINHSNDIFNKVDAIVLPTTVKTAYQATFEKEDTIKTHLNDALTSFANLIGSPAISIPLHTSKDGYPLGMQVITKNGNDHIMMQVARFLEKSR